MEGPESWSGCGSNIASATPGCQAAETGLSLALSFDRTSLHAAYRDGLEPAAGGGAVDLIADDPELTRHPALADQIAALVDEERAEYLEKG